MPIRDPDRLIEWARDVNWPRLFRFITRGGARGHSQETVRVLIRTFEERRWREEWKFRGQDEIKKRMDAEERRRKGELDEKKRLARNLRRNQQLEQMVGLSPGEFEVFVADVFRAQGYEAFAVGKSNDGGVDVEIYDRKLKNKWGVAQCKRYVGKRIAAKNVREFAGAFGLSKAEKGFYVTTSKFTRQATATAQAYPWLQIYDGIGFADFVASVYKAVADSGV